MKIEQASRKKAWIKLCIAGPSGTGKTYSSILLAEGLTGDLSKVCVIDTENGSADLYSHLGNYNTLTLDAPFTPERYIEAIDTCLKAGIQCIIIDTCSREWDNLLEYHASLPGSSFSSWSKVSPRHDAFINKMLQATAHVICNVRSKTEYILSEINGKQVPQKVGMKPIQRDNLEFEFTLMFEMDIYHRAKASKDRTGLFTGKPELIPTVETGRSILEWCNTGTETLTTVEVDDVLQAIHECTTIAELSALYYQFPQHQETLKYEYKRRKEEIINSFNQNKHLQNGTATVNQ